MVWYCGMVVYLTNFHMHIFPHILTHSPSHPHIFTLSQPQGLWTSFQKLLIAQMTELKNWCVHVWCVWVCACVMCGCACVMCGCVHVWYVGVHV